MVPLHARFFLVISLLLSAAACADVTPQAPQSYKQPIPAVPEPPVSPKVLSPPVAPYPTKAPVVALYPPKAPVVAPYPPKEAPLVAPYPPKAPVVAPYPPKAPVVAPYPPKAPAPTTPYYGSLPPVKKEGDHNKFEDEITERLKISSERENGAQVSKIVNFPKCQAQPCPDKERGPERTCYCCLPNNICFTSPFSCQRVCPKH